MKISYNWIKEFINVDLPADQVAEYLTFCGLEVEGMELFQTIAGGLTGLVIGEVLSCEKHPNADKLSITSVNIGAEKNLQIVCGAPNVAKGQKVVVATVGTTLYPLSGDPFEIKQSKIRGELSEGMICAEDEIGLGHSHDGIIVLDPETKVGLSAKEYFKVDEDTIFEIGLTPNRADAASHLGVARDLYAVLKSRNHIVPEIVLPVANELPKHNGSDLVSVTVENTEACPRYSGISVKGIKVGDSPAWLKNRLKAIGVSPINNIVDITNFVLHECGQPLHAFDADKIKDHKVVVRTAHLDEKFTTLDDVERKLFSEDLMICDSKDPMCIAGVFGGIHSGISTNTSNVFIESAYFNPDFIRKSGKKHGLKTDASFRFERGTDPGITVYALTRVVQLILEIAGGEIASSLIDFYPNEIKPAEFNFNLDFLDKFSGDHLNREKVRAILVSLDIQILKDDGINLLLRIPTAKVDVLRPVDVVEEVLRIYGYNQIPLPSKMISSLPAIVGYDRETAQNKTADFLASNGFYELLTNSLGKSTLDPKEASESNSEIKILNPLSQDLNVLRQEMLYSGLEVIAYNRNRKNSDLRLFEFGKVYSKGENKYEENTHLALYLTGRKFDISWNGDKAPVDFYFAKSFAENVLRRCKIDLSTLTYENISDALISNGLTLGTKDKMLVKLGSVRKSILKSFDIGNEVYYADLNWDSILRYSKKAAVQVTEVSKYPSVRRDLSMMIDSRVHFSQIESVAYKTERKLLKAINLFDVYQGDKIEQGKKSYAVAFILLDEHQTLTDKHIDKTMDKLMLALEKEVGAVIRKS